MKHLKILFNKLALILLLLYSIVNAQNNYEWEVGEELTYSVKYTFIKLGELKFKVLEKKNVNNEVVYRTMVYINSNESIPFVDLHEIYESYYNNKNYSNLFKATHRTKEYFRFTEHKFDDKNKKIFVKRGTLKPYFIETDSTCDLNHNFNDGLSLFYYARVKSGYKHSEIVNCFINEQKEKTSINFFDKEEKIKIEAVNYEILTTKLTGKADFTGVFGLTGDFEGWFTKDKFKVPVYAKLSVILGSITVELISWRKKDWNPPKYN
ncbi:MAG TPA: DUF3108 domain-containing protein [Melioribacteraceae bacterium]|nr:DUF3108 domain-containing protein [Melioribacteraceae bacterium]